MLTPLAHLETLDGYRQYFMDVEVWKPHVQAVCQRHHLHPCRSIRAGLAGSFPTFIVADRWVVKFFGHLFGGENAYQTEFQVNRLLQPSLAVPIPALLHFGDLLEDEPHWNWPYLIYEFIPGVSIGEIYDRVSLEDKAALARSLGEVTRYLIHLSLDGASIFQPGVEAYANFLQSQRQKCLWNHREWQSLPEPLIAQLEDYLLPMEMLLETQYPSGLIHADITRDHILGTLVGDRWVTSGLIDFGDARVGNIYYDLAALHLDLFKGDKRLLKAFMEAYGWVDQALFVQRAMSTALLHEFNVFSCLPDDVYQVGQVSSLFELASWIWGIDL